MAKHEVGGIGDGKLAVAGCHGVILSMARGSCFTRRI
jgi:hypothetical protein